jgi:hypothetical protein
VPEQTVPQKIELSEGVAYPVAPIPKVVLTSGEEMAELMSQAQAEENRWVNRQL